MKYITIIDSDFDSAVKKARKEYGHSIRIHSRRDTTRRGGPFWLAKRPYVELTCYLSDEAEHVSPKEEMSLREPESEELAPTPEAQVPPSEEERADDEKNADRGDSSPVKISDSGEREKEPSTLFDTYISHGRELLEENGFTDATIDVIAAMLTEEFSDRSPLPSKEEFELTLIDRIVSLLSIDHAHQINPPHYCILLGPTGVGKTTTIAKLGALYKLQESEEYQKTVQFLSVDTFRVGAYEQLAAFASSLDIPLTLIHDEQEMYRAINDNRDTDVLLVDTIGRSPKDANLSVQMNTLLSLIPPHEKKNSLVLPASMKSEDIMRMIDSYRNVGIDSLVVTKVDETGSIGNILSAAYEKNIPLLFLTDGQRVPSDLHKASATVLLSFLRGFSLDFETLWVNQSHFSVTD